MPQGSVPPTRAVLLQARRDLAFAREAHDLLDRKRQALIAHVLSMLEDAEDLERRLERQFTTAYEALGRARMSMGVERVGWVALSTAKETRVNVTERSIMGVPLPVVEVEPRELRLQYSLSGTTASVDRAVRAFGEVLSLACRVAETETTVWRLAREIRKTQRRVNALANVLIPEYASIVAQVEGALEEREREDFYRVKAVKRMRRKEGR
ncbi:MAG: V-type ATP synthase subunit D [Chloroflexi bacterium]|nr:V-type ATP synthase subunit D [Chloroflexota bacterium]MDA8189019.1 V-type ATP synthase subunit D [Dehalococcoidales bacterium]